MVATPDPPQMDTTAELTSIKTLLQNIASSISLLKSGMDAVQKGGGETGSSNG